MLAKVLRRLLVTALLTVPGGALAGDNKGGPPGCPPPGTFKIGTLAPQESPSGQVFQAWEKAAQERFTLADSYQCKGNKRPLVELTFYWNGQQGDEGAMVGKMKEGQLAGAAITAVGLGQIYRPILVLQLPGA